jgi:all-trans-retinol 13,14-reductase
MDFDAIVIGSGVGGLAVAGMLAKLNRKRVLVLEKHFQTGGLSHEFARGKFTWDVGLHYVGELGQGETARDIFDYLTDGELKWERMPHIFEKFVYPDVSVRVPSDPAEYLMKLVALFPAEERAIRRYFKDIKRAAAWHRTYIISKALPDVIAGLLKLLDFGKAQLALSTVKDYLDRNFGNRRLKAILASQWGDYGVPPRAASFAIHALIVNHYRLGAYFPVGGARSIARYMTRVIERAGGVVLAGQEATDLIVEDGVVKGVVISYPDGPEVRRSNYYAPVVVSDIGAIETYAKLLKPHIPIPERLESLFDSLSAVTVYLGLKESPEQLGINGENFWLYESYDLDQMADQPSPLLEGRPKYCYLSFPSLKNPEARSHTAEIIAFVDHKEFAAFADRPWLRREADYYALKDRMAQGLLDLVETRIAGFKKLVEYVEVSTPLSMEAFTSRSQGRMYGVPAVPEKFALTWLVPKTPLQNFFLSGSDVGSLGVVGALIGGVICASVMDGPFGFLKAIIAAKRDTRARNSLHATTAAPRALTRKQPMPGELLTRLVSKRQIGGTFYELTFGLSKTLRFVPGQHMYLQVDANQWRPYDIVSVAENSVTFIIDVSPGGPGSQFAINCLPGDENLARCPRGDFRLQDTDNREKTFIATGSGITPFLPMLQHLADHTRGEKLRLLWGVRNETHDFGPLYLRGIIEKTSLEITLCVSKPTTPDAVYVGTVTNKLHELPLDYENGDFYLCGNPGMIQDVHRFLRSNGASNIYFGL